MAAAEITAKPQAFGTESVSRGGSFWSPWREGARRKVFSPKALRRVLPENPLNTDTSTRTLRHT